MMANLKKLEVGQTLWAVRTQRVPGGTRKIIRRVQVLSVGDNWVRATCEGCPNPQRYTEAAVKRWRVRPPKK